MNVQRWIARREPNWKRLDGLLQLLLGIIPLLAIAGTIEGFFSPSPLVLSPIKYLVGTGLFCLLVLYCLRSKEAIVKF